VETKVLKQAVRRNIDRFPKDFMFEINKEELSILRSQIVTSPLESTRYGTMAFTEQGVAMLSSVLRSDAAIKVNIEIMRAFVSIRRMALNYSIWFRASIRWKKNSTTSLPKFFKPCVTSLNHPKTKK
jgi:hypothetical protein